MVVEFGIRVVALTVGLFSSVACGAIACDTPHRTRSPYAAAPPPEARTGPFRGGADFHIDRPRPKDVAPSLARRRPVAAARPIVDDDEF